MTATLPVHNPWVFSWARLYGQRYDLNRDLRLHGYAGQDVTLARAIADAYDAMPSAATDAATVASYAAFKREIGLQWDWAVGEMGMTFLAWTQDGQPYANSEEMRADVANNRRLFFFQGGDFPAGHPMMEPFRDGLCYNDAFRAIHDLFGHALGGYGFGPRGEENAWLSHAAMFSSDARPAMSSETRGQSSWVNFGAHLRRANGRLPRLGDADFLPLDARPYAEQKYALLPSWAYA